MKLIIADPAFAYRFITGLELERNWTYLGAVPDQVNGSIAVFRDNATNKFVDVWRDNKFKLHVDVNTTRQTVTAPCLYYTNPRIVVLWHHAKDIIKYRGVVFTGTDPSAPGAVFGPFDYVLGVPVLSENTCPALTRVSLYGTLRGYSVVMAPERM